MSHIEAPTRIEPLFFEGAIPSDVADLTVDLQREASGLGNTLHARTAAELADLVRVMNCYYSNLIEGHNTRPKDIERALAGAEVDPERRALALEAKAHVEVQREIDALHLKGKLQSPTSIEFVKWIHARFYAAMPGELRTIKREKKADLVVEPGAFRTGAEHDVAVGRHIPPSSDRITPFMEWFEKRYASAEKQSSMRIIAIAAAHHRFNYIHPFLDGNGRVSRLMSHAMSLRAGIGGHGLWSISRGLARGLAERDEYKQMMDHADSARRGDRDGRGNLSEAALKDFTIWFLSVCIDQIRFSSAMFDLKNLEHRYRTLAADVAIDKRAPDLISAVLQNGEISRGNANYFLKKSERAARSTMSELVRIGFLKSDTPKGDVRLGFPLDFRERLFPNLFTDAEVDVPRPPAIRI